MKTLVRLLALCTLIFTPAANAAPIYSGLYVFGDSLVDSGNAFLGTGGAQANPINGYYSGRFSNGLNFADYLSLALTGQPAIPALAGGTNLAVGGATAESKPSLPGQTFLSQLALYGTYVGTPIPSDALVLVTFGGNDVRDTIFVPGTPSFTQAAADLTTGLSLLYANGGRNFLITGSADIGLLPISIAQAGAIPGRLGELTDRSLDINSLFAGDAFALDAAPGANVTFFDLFAFEHNLLANPAHYGLPANLNTTTPCQIPGGGVPQFANCATSLYFDLIHPTTRVHLAIARGIQYQLGLTTAVPEPASWALMILGVGMVGFAMRGQRSAERGKVQYRVSYSRG